MENLLSDECQVRAAGQSNSAAASNDGEHEVKVTAETKEDVEGVKPQDREQKAKEARKESEAREHKERDRRALEKVPRERDRLERVRRERDRKDERKRECERRERAKVDRKSTNAVRSPYRSQKTWRGGKQDSPSTDAMGVRHETAFYLSSVLTTHA